MIHGNMLIKMFTLGRVCCTFYLLLETHGMNSRFPSSKDTVLNHVAVIEAPQYRINLRLQQSFLKNMNFGLRIQFSGNALA